MVARRVLGLCWALLLGLSLRGQAQPPAVLTWQKSYGTQLEEKEGYSVPVPGGYLLLGEQEQLANTLATLYLVRTDLQGDTLWTRRVSVPGTLNPHITGCLADPAGNLLVTGLEYTSNLGFVVKLNGNGVPIWTQTSRATDPNAIFSSTAFLSPLIDNDGNCVVIKGFSHQYSGNPTRNSISIVKFNQASGSELWDSSMDAFCQANFDPGTAGSFWTLFKTSTGFCIVLYGRLTSTNQYALVLLRTGPTGIVTSFRSRPLALSELIFNLAIYNDPAGNTLVAGRETLTKYSPQGDTLWHTVVPSRYAGRKWQGAAIGQDAQGNYVVVGNSRLTISGTVIAENVHMARFRPTGQLVNDTMLYRPGQTYGRSVALAASGELVVSGYTLNGIVGGADLFMYQFNGFRPLASRSAAMGRGRLQAYPNPAGAGVPVQVQLPAGAGRGELALFDALGHRLRQQLLPDGSPAEARLSTAGLPPGLYVLRLVTPNGLVWTGKVTCE